MNIYLVVEGPVGEKQVYSHWVPLVNPNLRIVNDLDSVQTNSLIIVSGGGYPNYFDVIEAGVRDVESNPILDRLVVAVDSEDMARADKKAEIDNFILTLHTTIDYRIVVQHFCLETWALGNPFIVARNPKDSKIREYREYYDVLNGDPELLPAYPQEYLNRSQFAERYLRKLLNDKYRNLTYRKSNPTVLLHDKYFQRVKDRYNMTGHIPSFADFLTAFI